MGKTVLYFILILSALVGFLLLCMFYLKYVMNGIAITVGLMVIWLCWKVAKSFSEE